MDKNELTELLVSIIDERFEPKPVEMAKRYQGGTLKIEPSDGGQAKEIPLEVFFKKITSVRESLRVLEQKINNHPVLTHEDRFNLQVYITKVYGSLTTFNILFRGDKDKFVGFSDKDKKSDQEKMTIATATKKLGLNEYSKK